MPLRSPNPGCPVCEDGRFQCDPGDPRCDVNAKLADAFPGLKEAQAAETRDQEPFKGRPGGCYHCQGGTLPCICPADREASRGDRKALAESLNAGLVPDVGDPRPVPMPALINEDRRYARVGRRVIYLSPAEEEAVRLAERDMVGIDAIQLAAIENAMAAEAMGLATEEEAVVATDMVNLPGHYARFKIEPIRFIVENGLNWFQGNIVKYGARAEHKHETPQEDIEKIIRYAEMWRDYAAGDPDWWLPANHPKRRASGG